MAEKIRIINHTAATELDETDYLLADSETDGERKVLGTDFGILSSGSITAMIHRNILRKKSLGSSVTSAQQTAISNGTFDDLYLGDYWTIDSIDWRIADFDYPLRTGSTFLTTHNLAIVPDVALYDIAINTENTTSGGYVGSEMYTTNLETAKTTIESAFGDLLLTRSVYLTNAVTSGYPSGGAWFDSTVELMNEPMVYGCYITAAMSTGLTTSITTTTDKQQLALFKKDPTYVNINKVYWLRDVVSSNSFAYVTVSGVATYGGASNSRGVRPVFFIGC